MSDNDKVPCGSTFRAPGLFRNCAKGAHAEGLHMAVDWSRPSDPTTYWWRPDGSAASADEILAEVRGLQQRHVSLAIADERGAVKESAPISRPVKVDNAQDKRAIAKLQGFEGLPCPSGCGSLNTRWNGKCLFCHSCQQSGGCS